jgi:hypothetical protein
MLRVNINSQQGVVKRADPKSNGFYVKLRDSKQSIGKHTRILQGLKAKNLQKA